MLSITYLGHASFLIKSDTASVVFDPYQNGSVPGLIFPHVKADRVICSHEHADHNARELVELTNKEINLNIDTIVVPHDHHNGEKRGMNNINILEIEGIKIAHMGDVGSLLEDDELEKIKGVDIMMIPINGFFTISAFEAKILTDKAKPRLVIPMHYYDKEAGTGYKDQKEIEEFKHLYRDFMEVNSYTVVVNDNLFKNKVVIFKKGMQ